MKLTMLVVEDDEGLRSSLEQTFARKGYEVLTATRAEDALRLLRTRDVALVLADIRLADGSGLDVLAAARALDDETIVIMMTAFPEVKTAVHAMKQGAHDFIIKPFELEALHLTVARALELRALRRNVRQLDHERRRRGDVTEILGADPAIARLHEHIRKVAASDTPVLVVGPTGTGKELVADSIHRLSARATGPLVKVNCSAFSDQLLESELFGHEKGAFTDAKDARPGLFEMANGGTLFLDEISELKAELQAKLLRVVEGQPFRRVGGQREIRTDVRVVAATNRDLPARIRTGDFREDLYFRLNVFQIGVPPLAARGKDIVLLARFFLERSAAALRKGALRLDPAAEEILLAYAWPGNVRELRNVMERAAILCEGDTVGVEHLPRELHASAFVHRQAPEAAGPMPSLAEIERRYLEHVVQSAQGNLSLAARIAGVSRNTLKSKLRLAEESPPAD